MMDKRPGYYRYVRNNLIYCNVDTFLQHGNIYNSYIIGCAPQCTHEGDMFKVYKSSRHTWNIHILMYECICVMLIVDVFYHTTYLDIMRKTASLKKCV